MRVGAGTVSVPVRIDNAVEGRPGVLEARCLASDPSAPHGRVDAAQARETPPPASGPEAPGTG